MSDEFQEGDQVSVIIPNVMYVARSRQTDHHFVKVAGQSGTMRLPDNAIVELVNVPFEQVGYSPGGIIDSQESARAVAPGVEPLLRANQAVEVRFKTKISSPTVLCDGTILVNHPQGPPMKLHVPITAVTAVDDPANDSLGTIRRHDETGAVVVGVRGRNEYNDGKAKLWRIIENGTASWGVTTTRTHEGVSAARGWRIVGDIGGLMRTTS